MDVNEHTDVIVVGGGLAGLSAAMRCAEKGHHVTLVSMIPARRSHSVCAQGGINAAMNLKNEGDSPYIHAYDTIHGGDFLANQPPVLEMCLAAPGIVRMMERLGCPFNRTPEGNLDVRRFGGTLYFRTAYCDASTGQQLLYALDEQVRRYEAQGRIVRKEHHEFLRCVLDEQGTARGIVLMDHYDLSLHVLKSSVVIIATGGIGMVYKRSTNSTTCTGAAAGRLFTQGAHLANGEFIQIHPTAIPGGDKLRLISESVRGEGGRIWVRGDASKSIETPEGNTIPCGRTGEPWYFLEELYPVYGNLVPRDIGARAIMRVCELGLGIDGKDQVYLDVTHLPEERLSKIESVLDIYTKFTGCNPRQEPMKIFPAVHYSMGGLWVDWPAADDPDRSTRFRQMTSIPGCFCVGEADYEYHGANRLGANALLACIFAGLTAAEEVSRYRETLSPTATPFTEALAQEEAIKADLMSRQGKENVHALHDVLSDTMVKNVTVKKSNSSLEKTLQTIGELKERFQNISLDDRGAHLNQTYIFAHQFPSILELASAITTSALHRNEFRGAHFKPEYPQRDDAHFLKTTLATYTPSGIDISFLPVDTRHFDPLPRDYSQKKKMPPAPKNLPSNIQLPV